MTTAPEPPQDPSVQAEAIVTRLPGWLRELPHPGDVAGDIELTKVGYTRLWVFAMAWATHKAVLDQEAER